MIPSLSADNVITRVALMFTRKRKTACKVVWTDHVSNVRVAGLAVSCFSWYFQNSSSRGTPLVMRFNEELPPLALH